MSRSLTHGRGALLRELNRRMLALAPPAVTVLDLEHVSALVGKRHWFDPSYWHSARQYPAAEALPSLVEQQVALLRASLGLSRKVLVLDLDNTLWGGVIGEDGLHGIRLGAPSPAGEAHQALQQYAVELKQRGVLLAVCSKNNEADARLPFEQHDAMRLRLDDFVAFRANWLDKPSNLRAIAEQLQLGVDSLVFLDDNPVERALVRRELPEVAVPEVSADPADLLRGLDRGRYFEALTLSPEDRERHQSYRANALRAELRSSAASLPDFLHHLDMVAECGPFDATVLPRVAQLIGKTNQFNLTSRRHAEAELRRICADAGAWTQYFKLADRFGDNGLVGVLIARSVADADALWEIDTLLLSCRVIGRHMELLMLEVLAAAAAARGITRLRGVYIPTTKNAQVAELYPRLGFGPAQVQPDGSSYFLLDLSKATLPRCEFIQLAVALGAH